MRSPALAVAADMLQRRHVGVRVGAAPGLRLHRRQRQRPRALVAVRQPRETQVLGQQLLRRRVRAGAQHGLCARGSGRRTRVKAWPLGGQGGAPSLAVSGSGRGWAGLAPTRPPPTPSTAGTGAPDTARSSTRAATASASRDSSTDSSPCRGNASVRDAAHARCLCDAPCRPTPPPPREANPATVRPGAPASPAKSSC